MTKQPTARRPHKNRTRRRNTSLTAVLFVAGAALLTLGHSVLAQAPTYETRISADRSEVRFTLGAVGHTVKGSLPIVEGALQHLGVTGDATGQIVLDLQNATTQNARRDKKMHTQVLLTSRHPTAVFRLEQLVLDEGTFEPESQSRFRLKGQLELLGTQHPAELNVTTDFQKRTTSEAGGDSLPFTATATLEIPYVDWGLKDPSVVMLRVKKVVQVQISAVGELVTQNPAGTAQSLTIEITDLGACTGCGGSIARSVGKVKGVASATLEEPAETADQGHPRLLITFEDSVEDPNALVPDLLEAIQRVGYTPGEVSQR